MEKKILLIITFFLSILSIDAQYIGYDYGNKNISDLDKTDLIGKVKSVLYSDFEVVNNFGKISKGSKKWEQEILFNEDGTLNKRTEYDSNGELIGVYVHEYENGEIKLISHYDSIGNLIEKTAFIKEGLDIREQNYGSDGTKDSEYFIRSYDLQGNMIKEVSKFPDNLKTYSITKYYYDKFNRVIKYVNDGDDVYTLTYKDNFSKTLLKIDKTDKITKKTYVYKRFEFDSKGSILKKYKYEKLSRSYEYIYDNKNNWINQIVFKTESIIPYEIIERKILYFE